MSVISNPQHQIGGGGVRFTRKDVFHLAVYSSVTTLAITIGVGVETALESLLSAVFGVGGIPLLGAALTTLLAAAIEGGVVGAGTLLLTRNWKAPAAEAVDVRDWGAAIAAGAATGIAISVMVGLAMGAGGGGSPDGFWPLALLFAFTIVVGMILGISLFIATNGGLRFLGLKTVAGMTSRQAETIAEKRVSSLFGRNWADRCRRLDDGCGVILRGGLTGLVGGAAVFHLKALSGPEHGFGVSVLIQLVGSTVAVIVSGLILSFVSSRSNFSDFYRTEFVQAVGMFIETILITVLVLVVAAILLSH